MIPHDSLVAVQLRGKLEDTVIVLFLPVYFAFTGLRTQIGFVQGLEQWAICGLIILLAFIGKFAGSYVAARLTGLDNNMAACTGVLMNTRGLMELIVLNLGPDLGILSPGLFAMFVRHNGACHDNRDVADSSLPLSVSPGCLVTLVRP